MAKTFRNGEEAHAWQDQYDPLAPKAGDVAPDFALYDISGEHLVRLSELKGKQPVALIFGSFT